jgi:hypothetical protein
LHPSWTVVGRGSVWKHLGPRGVNTGCAQAPRFKARLSPPDQYTATWSRNQCQPPQLRSDDEDSYSNKPSTLARRVTFLTYGLLDSRSAHLSSSFRFLRIFPRSSNTITNFMERATTREISSCLDTSSAFHGTRRFNTEFTRALHLSLS